MKVCIFDCIVAELPIITDVYSRRRCAGPCACCLATVLLPSLSLVSAATATALIGLQELTFVEWVAGANLC